MPESSFLLDRTRDILAAAAPNGKVFLQADPARVNILGRTRARLDLPAMETISRAFLDPVAGAQFVLTLYPGDTLEQSRAFFGDPARVRSVLELRSRGWAIEPNMHFGHTARGLAWTRSGVDADTYCRYWSGGPDLMRAWERDEWERNLGELATLGILDPTDTEPFEHDFTNTKRTKAVPRPGLRLERRFEMTDAVGGDLVGAVREALRQALTALREPLHVLAAGIGT